LILDKAIYKAECTRIKLKSGINSVACIYRRYSAEGKLDLTEDAENPDRVKVDFRKELKRS